MAPAYPDLPIPHPQVNPALHRGLQQLLDFDGDVEAAFALSFQASQEAFGCVTAVDLCEGGAARAVTAENRREYAELYARWCAHEYILFSCY